MTPTLRALVREILLVAVYNTAIALFLAVLTNFSFATNLVYSQCIGFAIYGGIHGAGRWRGRAKPGVGEAALGIPFGLVAGFMLATWANGYALADVLALHPGAITIAAAAALLFGALGTWHFHNEAKLYAAQAEARAARLARAEQEAATTQAELARLQAQIEPHFLFNTLSNVVGLIDTDPAAARGMLQDLTALLRTSLTRTRRSEVTLAEELDLLRAYLGIMARRMGPRLTWTVTTDPDLPAVRLPPLLVQPLVENAIRHGLEPQPAGGSLSIHCRRVDERVEIVVADSGHGFSHDGSKGVGLANVRARLAACYGGQASLALETNAAGGVTAKLQLPLEPICAS